MTVNFINSNYEDVAIFAIEFWTTMCEVELERDKKNLTHSSIISRCSESILNIMKIGLCKINMEFETD